MERLMIPVLLATVAFAGVAFTESAEARTCRKVRTRVCKKVR